LTSAGNSAWEPAARCGSAWRLRNVGFKLQVQNKPQADPLPTRLAVGAQYHVLLPARDGALPGERFDLRVAADVDSPWGSRASRSSASASTWGTSASCGCAPGYAFGAGRSERSSIGLGVESGSVGVDLARTFLTGSDLQIENPAFFSFRSRSDAPRMFGLARRSSPWHCAPRRTPRRQRADTAAPPPRVLLRPLASLLLPGAGQLMGGQDRGAVYLATEIYFVSRFLQLNRDASREADLFQALAYDVARRAYSPRAATRCSSTSSKWSASTRVGATTPTRDRRSCPRATRTPTNGFRVAARPAHVLGGPRHAPRPDVAVVLAGLAVLSGARRGTGFRWSWRDHSLEHEVFRETIRRSDDGFRGAQNQVGYCSRITSSARWTRSSPSRLAAAAGRAAALHTTVGRRGAVSRSASPSDWTSHDLAREPRDLDRPLTLTVLEIVLGIDNIVFLPSSPAKLPPSQQPRARRIGLASPCCSVSRCWPRLR